MNGTVLKINKENRTGRIGYYISLFGAALIMLGIGIFKFTPTEAEGIKHLVENHFLTFFVYDIVSVQTVSDAIGTIEIIIALLLVFSVKFASLRKYAAIGMIVTSYDNKLFIYDSGNLENGRRGSGYRLLYLKRSDAFRIWFNDFK